jgi:hypothetical protein
MPLLSLLNPASEEGNDRMLSTIGNAFPDVGPAVLLTLEQFLVNPSHHERARILAAEMIGTIAKRYPEAYEERLIRVLPFHRTSLEALVLSLSLNVNELLL